MDISNANFVAVFLSLILDSSRIAYEYFGPNIISSVKTIQVSFKNNKVKDGVTYEWSWGDGSSNTITSDEIVEHSFENQSTTTALQYNVTLVATAN